MDHLIEDVRFGRLDDDTRWTVCACGWTCTGATDEAMAKAWNKHPEEARKGVVRRSDPVAVEQRRQVDKSGPVIIVRAGVKPEPDPPTKTATGQRVYDVTRKEARDARDAEVMGLIGTGMTRDAVAAKLDIPVTRVRGAMWRARHPKGDGS